MIAHILSGKSPCVTLAIHFGGRKEPSSRFHSDEINTEAALMQALAEHEEDDRLVDGVVEINSDDEFTR